jgi:MFS family permease
MKLTGKQTGWVYATLPIACVFMPLLAGWIADSYVNAEWVIIVAHLIGAVLLFIAARQNEFKPMLIMMLLFSLCYAATLPLVNAVLFAATDDGALQGKVFLWAPVAWALVGWGLTGWRMTRKEQGDGRDCLYLASGLSVLMVLAGFYLTSVSPTPPPAAGFPLEGVLGVIQGSNFIIFLLVSLVVFGLMQFYFLATAQFMQDIGIASKHVPASMALAQIAQALATWFLLGLFIEDVGFKLTLTFGAACWMILYFLYTLGKPRWLMIVGQPLHGLAYVFFVIVGQVFVNAVSPPEILSSMQALIFVATTGVGLFLGTQFAGFVMDANSKDGKFQWPKVWIVPAVIVLAGVLVLVTLFQNPPA